MKFIADFHIHSHYSMATSPKLVPEYLDLWSRIKGISVMGTGDFIHPGWYAELKKKFEPAEEGLYRLKQKYRIIDDEVSLPPGSSNDTRFMLTGEVSSIYKKYGKVRKVHNLIVSPSFESAEGIWKTLDKMGNIRSDGRPILGIDSRDILEIVLEKGPGSFLIPAHIWTPWFSVLGSKSGFDTVAECYGDLADHIFAVETGLSSDPEMNWMCSMLDQYTLVSNSDAHSPEKLGREATLFDTELSFPAIRAALEDRSKGYAGTIEFFPQEGKYHYDGHRKCGVCMNPLETLKADAICPECGKKMTVGVMYRVAELADRDPEKCPVRHPYDSITSLRSLLCQVLNVAGQNTKKIKNAYFNLIENIGTEFNILLHAPIEDIAEAGGDDLAEVISRMRSKEAFIEDGYDGEFGKITFLDDSKSGRPKGINSVEFSIEEYKKLLAEKKKAPPEGEQMTFF